MHSEISMVELYRRFQEQNLNYGSSFQGVKQLFHQETVALGKNGAGEIALE